MFKLESYVTPLLLSYVNKYIKNLKPEDSQLSLWGGDASFCNLDLRLDVLEQELDLPFTLVNGHIHELRIHVPWTKLGSEPVVITINTIECILKLQSDCSVTNDGAGRLPRNAHSPLQRTSCKKEETPEAPPGYVQSLINRVISNICIICNNLILKYVEDDIVLSLNIKSAELYNVDEKWERAFVDISPTEPIVRKVVSTQDLTVCLDKRDACGKIEAYQDPLLYRCSTVWRIYTVYSMFHSVYPLVTRINMLCDKLDFSLTDQQLPMFLRLAKLCYALQYKDAYINTESKNGTPDCLEKCQQSEGESGETVPQLQDGSWGSWMWSFIPFSWEEKTDESKKEIERMKSQKIFQFGIFVQKASCVFKTTDAFQDTCFVPPKYVFSPFAVLHLYGSSMEITMKGKAFVNVLLGVTGATMAGQNKCVCNFADKSCTDITFIRSGIFPGNGDVFTYLSSTLFDPLAPENCGESQNYCFEQEQHLSEFTEDVMAKKFPAFALDYIYTLQIPEEWLDKTALITPTFLEESNWKENSVCRVIFGPFSADINSQIVHAVEKILKCCMDCDYPPYLKQETGRNQFDVLEIKQDDIHCLEEFLPQCSYSLSLFKPVVRVFVADHQHFDGAYKRQTRKWHKRKKAQEVSPNSSNSPFPLLTLEFQAHSVVLQKHCSMYPDRVAQIVNSVSTASENAAKFCFSHYSFEISYGVALFQNQCLTSHVEKTLISPSSVSLVLKMLDRPQYWDSNTHLQRWKVELMCSEIGTQLTESQLLGVICLYQSWMAIDFNFDNLYHCSMIGTNHKEQSKLCFKTYGVEYCFVKTGSVEAHKASISSVCIKLQNADHSTILMRAPELTSDVHKGENFLKEDILDSSDAFESPLPTHWLQFLIQKPNQFSSDPCLLNIYISGTAVCLEPALLKWLNWEVPCVMEENIASSGKVMSPSDIEDDTACSSQTRVASGSHSFSRGQSLTGEENVSWNVLNAVEEYFHCNQNSLKHLILQVEFQSFIILLPKSFWCVENLKNKSALQSWKYAVKHQHLQDACFVCLPKVHIKNNGTSVGVEPTFSNFENDLPVLVTKEDKHVDGFPWTLKVNNCSVYTICNRPVKDKVYFLWNPCGASATVAVTSKLSLNQLALCVHIDTTALSMSCSASQVSLLADCISTFSIFAQYSNFVKLWMSNLLLKPLSQEGSVREEKQVSVAKGNSSIQQKVIESGKETTEERSVVAGETAANVLGHAARKITLWIQLTVSKFGLNFYGKFQPNNKTEYFHLLFVGEELITSVDIQDVYCKAKMKISSMNVNCYSKRDHEWQSGPYEGIVLCCSDRIHNIWSFPTCAANHHMSAKIENQPFLLLTYTQALCISAKQKWKASVDQLQACHGTAKYISEIDISVRPFDMILWASLLRAVCDAFSPLASVFARSHGSNELCEAPRGMSFSNQTLPLVYVKTSMVCIFLPKRWPFVENSNSIDAMDSSKTRDLSVRPKPDMLYFCLEYLNLTSQVENPLSRIILNADLYSFALNSKTLALPGSDIEDRQYQLDISGLSLGSVAGCHITRNSCSTKGPHATLPPIMSENPALEWNIGVVNESRKHCVKDSIAVAPLLSSFSVRIAVAPAIVSNNKFVEDFKEGVIISGITVEVSVTNEISLYLSARQMELFEEVMDQNIAMLFKSNCRRSESNMCLEARLTHDTSKSLAADIQRDSGLGSESSTMIHCSLPNDLLAERTIRSFVPFELLITAGSVSLVLFVHEDDLYKSDKKTNYAACKQIMHKCTNLSHTDMNNFTSPIHKLHSCTSSCANNQSCFVGTGLHNDGFLSDVSVENNSRPVNVTDENCLESSDSSENNSGRVFGHCGKKPTILPIILVSILQPHAFLKCHRVSQKFEASCFDFQVKGSHNRILEEKDDSTVPSTADYTFSYLETKPGKPHEKTGISPAFCTFTCSDFLNEPASVVIHVDRPVKFNISACVWDKCETGLRSFKNMFSHFNSVWKSHSNSSEYCSATEKLRRESSEPRFSNLSTIGAATLSTTQLLIEVHVEHSQKPVILSVSMDGFMKNIEMVSAGVSDCKMKTSVRFENFAVQMTHSDETWPMLLPTSISLNLKCQVKPYFQVNASIDSETVVLNFSLKHLLLLSDVVKNMKENLCEKFSGTFLFEPQNVAAHDNCEKSSYWSDDLRKGSFSFIQASDQRNSHPNAYEVVFTKAQHNQPAAMTWRYPEPRCLTKIEVSPVPLLSSVNSTGKETLQVVTCYVQCWDNMHHEFQNFCQFELSESSYCSLCFPLCDTNSVLISNLWRVVLDFGDVSFEEGEAFSMKNESFLSPLALAACMSIDSCFQKSLVPSLQLVTSFSLLRVNLYSAFSEEGCMLRLFPHKFDGAAPAYQVSMSVSIENAVINLVKWFSSFKLEGALEILCNVTEYRNLTALPLFEPIQIKLYANASYPLNKRPVVESEVVLESCLIKISQSVIHSLNYALHSCFKVLHEEDKSEQENEMEFMLPNYYFVCNNLQEPIRFGQTDTEESIILSSHNVHGYSWRSHKCKQMLRVCLECMKWKWSKPIHIDKCGLQTIELEKDTLLYIIVKQISNMQKQIIFEGEMKIFSFLTQDVYFKLNIIEPLWDSEEAFQKKEIEMILRKLVGISFVVSSKFRFNLALKDVSDGLPWSRDVSIDENGPSVLINLPGNEEKNILVQAVRTQNATGVYSTVVFVCPPFVIHNNLPFSLHKVTDSHYVSNYSVFPAVQKGCEVQVYDDLVSKSSLELGFENIEVPYNFVKISLAGVEMMTEKQFLNSDDIELLCSSRLRKHHTIKSYRNFEESPNCTLLENNPSLSRNEMSFSPLTVQQNDPNCKIDAEASLKWKGLNAVLINIKPWAVFVNDLEIELILVYAFEKWRIRENSTFIPPVLDGHFTLGVEMENYIYSSQPILLCHEENMKGKLSMESRNLIADSVDLVINCACGHKNKILIFQLRSEVCEGIHILTATPLIYFKNNTNQELHILLTAVSLYSNSVVLPKVKSVVTVEAECSNTALLLWETTSIEQFHFLPQGQADISFYVQFCVCHSEEHAWCRPTSITLDSSLDIRRTVVISSSTSDLSCSLPFVLSSHKRQNLLFLFFSDDPCPFLLLHNRSNLNLFYGQSVSGLGNITTYEEIDRKIILPSLAPGMSSYYTFPAIQKCFPVPLDSVPKLHLGCKDSNAVYGWSSPIDVHLSHQFVCIPDSHYVRISHERHGHTICLFIDLVNRIEFTAKEVRSRIGMTNLCTVKYAGSKTSASDEAPAVQKYVNQKSTCLSFCKRADHAQESSLCESCAICFTVRTSHVSLIFCDELKKIGRFSEVIRINMDNAFLLSRPNETSESPHKMQEVCLCFEHVQVDNQVDQEERTIFDFPVILKRHSNSELFAAAEPSVEFLPNKVREKAFVTLDVILEVPYSQRKMLVHTVDVNFQCMSLYLEDTLYYKVLSLFKSYLPFNFHRHQEPFHHAIFAEDVACISNVFINPVRMKSIRISMKEVYLTVHASLKLYLSVESSLLRFQDFERNELFTNTYELGRIMIVHYLTGTLFRAGWVVGSLDLLGNPANFARAVGMGLSDFFILPYRGFLNGPRAFVAGLSHGAVSLVSGISSGAITCVTNLATSISRNMDILSLDAEHLERQEMLRRQFPAGLTGGLLQGLSGFGICLLGAVAGMVDHPMQVILTSSNPLSTAKGVVGGFGKGLIGVFTKPVAGAAELVSKTGRGLLKGAGWLSQPMRQYQPITLIMEELPNSSMKYICKIVQTSTLGELLLSVVASYVNKKKKYEENILLLTSKVLCVFSAGDDSQLKTFSLTEVKCRKLDQDKNALLITLCDESDENLPQELSKLKDRVADYVKKSWLFSSESAQFYFGDTSMRSSDASFTFFVEPYLRDVFHAMFSSAKRKLQKKGFTVE